jgi:thiamine-phosphate pyrophosphorylase
MTAIVLPRLYAIVDVDVCARAGWAPVALAQAYLGGGARLLQLRAKSCSSAELLDLSSAIAAHARAAGAQLIVNDRADVAVLSGADGVHVGQEDLRPEDVRRIVGDEVVVGLSTHTDAQIATALDAAISYLAIGPVFQTRTKDTGYDRVGYEMVRHAATEAERAGLPVVAIGGITLDTAPRVIEAGAAAVAVISDLVTDDPERRVREYVSALG